MSHNKEIEKKIGVVDSLISEMENHRDQAKLFQAAAEALKEMNRQIANLDGQFAELSSEAIHERFVALEAQSRKVVEKVEGDSQDLNRNLREHGLKISGLENRQLEFMERSQSNLEKLLRELKKGDASVSQQLKSDSQSLQKRLEALDSKMNGLEKKLQSSVDQSLTDTQKLAGKITKIDELSNDMISQVIGLRSATRDAIEDTRAETRTIIEQSRDSSCELITSGKDQTIELLKEENAQIKELIAEQSQRSQKWSIILLIVGLCASGIGGAALYFLLTFQQ
jgi:hypothetical protein